MGNTSRFIEVLALEGKQRKTWQLTATLSFTVTEKLCEAARAGRNIYLLSRWYLCVETDNLPSNLHHISFPSTNIDKLILTSAKNRNVPSEHNRDLQIREPGPGPVLAPRALALQSCPQSGMRENGSI